VSAVIGLGTPVGQVDDRSYDFSCLKSCTKPKLLVSGDRDQFGSRAQLERLASSLPEPKNLVIIEGADHFFEGRLQAMRETVETWIKQVTGLPGR
jgi:uncharacterized protein